MDASYPGDTLSLAERIEAVRQEAPVPGQVRLPDRIGRRYGIQRHWEPYISGLAEVIGGSSERLALCLNPA